MKKKRKRLRHSNKGFTLVELLVTMLISSIVTMAVAGFLSMGLQFYNKTNAETELQTESQVAELFLTELLQESEDYRAISVGEGHPDGVTYALEVKRGDSTYLTIKKGGVLLFAKLDEPEASDLEKISEVISKEQENTFLAKHVTDFLVVPETRSKAIDEMGGLVNLQLSFSVSEKNYTGNATIALRNAVRN